MPSEESLFADALEIETSAAREDFLRRNCAHDPALLARLQRLLAADAQSERVFAGCIANADALQEAAPVAGEFVAELSADELRIARIGRYKLLQRLGEGGCGVVYLAEQTEPVRRPVALKVIKLGMDTKSVIARFDAERQALALMDHPNIAKVLDAGATDAGRPYFVMELVRGVRITEYCDQNQLDTRQRLNLFIQTCHAIQHAHQKGIIHRDIKPSNVLVTIQDGKPVPKVIDFGIAKATEGSLTDKTLFTLQEQFIGTPAYMSPEQAAMSGLDIDTRSDIYSLGVLLYELLTGKTPFDSKELLQSGLDQMRRTLLEKEPHRPSTRLDTLLGDELTATALHRQSEPPKLKLQLKGDLDWIVMKALEKDRARRYETTNGLALDVQRHLNNEPVLARPPGRLYRFQKLVRRNQGVFAAIAAISLTLLVALGISTLFFFREREARQRAVAAEKQQSQLRQEAENRERITQATLLISQNKFDEADELMSHVAITMPTLEGAAALRSLGEWHALQNQWSLAAERFTALLEVNESDKWDVATLDFLRCGAALVKLGDWSRYKIICQKANERFAHTDRPTVAERILKLNLLSPAGGEISGAFQRFAEMATPKIPVSIGTLPLADSAANPGSQPKLQLQDFATGQPFSISNEADTTVIIGGGSNIWGSADSFVFAWTLATNDFDYRLRVLSVADTDSENKSGKHFSRAGLMARDSLTERGSHQIAIVMNSGGTFQKLHRTVVNGLTTDNNSLWPAYGSNSWMRLQRVGTQFYTYSSNDGIDWTQLFQFDSVSDPDGPFASPLYIGIAVCAQNPATNTTAVVSDFGVTPTVPVGRTIMLALLEYRRGNHEKAVEWCRRCLGGYPDYSAARVAAAHAIMSMSCNQLHQAAAARMEQLQAAQMLQKKFAANLDLGDSAQGFWFDWIFADALKNESSARVK